MHVLMDGAMKALSGRRFERCSHHQGERYTLLAFFPRTGILEPLGVVHSVRLAELM